LWARWHQPIQPINPQGSEISFLQKNSGKGIAFGDKILTVMQNRRITWQGCRKIYGIYLIRGLPTDRVVGYSPAGSIAY